MPISAKTNPGCVTKRGAEDANVIPIGLSRYHTAKLSSTRHFQGHKPNINKYTKISEIGITISRIKKTPAALQKNKKFPYKLLINFTANNLAAQNSEVLYEI